MVIADTIASVAITDRVSVSLDSKCFSRHSKLVNAKPTSIKVAEWVDQDRLESTAAVLRRLVLESNQCLQLASKKQQETEEACMPSMHGSTLMQAKGACHNAKQKNHSCCADLSTTVGASSKRWRVSSSRGKLDASQYDKAKGSSCSC